MFVCFDDMATSGGAGNDELTSCPICLETFTRPKFLQCLHSFCEGCISTFREQPFDFYGGGGQEDF